MESKQNVIQNPTQWKCSADPQGRLLYTDPTGNHFLAGVQPGFQPTNALWRQLKNKHGRTYYYNTLTKLSQWSVPDGFVDFNTFSPINFVMTPYGYTTIPHSQSNSDPQPSEPPTEPSNSSVIKNKAFKSSPKAISSFIEMLDEVVIKPDSDWEAVLPAISVDDRFKKVKNRIERKNLFLQWKTRKSAEEEESEKTLIDSKKSSLDEMLKECSEVRLDSNTEEIERLLRLDDRFKAIDDKKMRDNILYKFSKSLLKREKLEFEKKRIESLDKLETFLRESEEFLTDTPWGKVWKLVKTKPFCRFLSEEDVFELTEHLRKDAVVLSKSIQDENDAFSYQDQEAKIRNNFRDLLERYLKENRFNSSSDIKKIISLCKNDKEYLSLKKQTNDADEIISDYLENIRKEKRKDEKVIRSLIAHGKLDIDVSLSVTENENLMLSKNIDYVLNIRSLYRRLIIDEIIDEKRKRIEWEEKQFEKVLKRRKLSKKDRWEEVKKQLKGKKEFECLGEVQRKRIFEVVKSSKSYRHRRKKERHRRKNEKSDDSYESIE